MKGLKTIVLLSFILTLYPILSIPGYVKEWGAALMAFTILITSGAMIFVQNTNSTEGTNHIFKDTSTSGESEVTE